MDTRRRSSALIGLATLAAGVLVAVALHLLKVGGPPIYDGLPIPTEYHYVSPPPDLASTNQPPSGAQADLNVNNGQLQSGQLQTPDAQVFAFFPAGSLRVSPAAQRVSVRIDPVREPPHAPPGFTIRGNVYQISAVEQPGGAAVVAVSPIDVTLFIPPGPFTNLQLYTGSTWTALQTNYVNDRYPVARITALGDIAATATAPAASPPSGSGTGGPNLSVPIVAGAALLILLLGAALLMILARQRREPERRQQARVRPGKRRR